MSLCINPQCRQPDHPSNSASLTCQACGSDLLLQGRYRVMRLISDQSGFGRVYEAYERDIPKILKVLKESYNHNEKVLTLFRREAQVLSHLNHPGVPKVAADGYFLYYPQGSGEPSHCLVMEKIDGPNLKEWMVQQGNHPISEKQALLWLTQLTDVLHLVHQQNYFHRDIKPENIMLRASGQLVLVDFGAAREMTQTYMAHLGDSDITAVSSAGFTPPEQEQGQAVPQSDFYALGRTLIYLLTAKMPNDPAIYDPRTNAFRWRNYAPQISQALADLVDELTAPAAADRPQTTRIILDRLAQVRVAQGTRLPVANQSHPSPPPAWPVTTLDPQEAVTQADALRPWLPPWLDQRPWVLAGLTGLALAVPLAWWALSRSQPPAPLDASALTAAAAPSMTVTPLASLAGHSGEIKDLLLLRDGKTLISASADDTIRIWDLDAGALKQTLDQHGNVVKALAMTTDQSTLISTGDDRTLRFWRLPSGQPIGVIENAHGVPMTALAVSHNGKLMASADSDGTIKLWNLSDPNGTINPQAFPSLQPWRTLKADGTVNDLRFAGDDSFLASGGKQLQIWDLAALAESPPNTAWTPVTLEGHTSFVNQIALSDDNQTLISASADRTVRLWDVASRSPKAVLTGHQSFVNDLRVDGPRLWSADEDRTMVVWNLNQVVPMRKIEGFDTDIWRFTVRPNGDIVTVGGNQPYTIRLWRPDGAVLP
ncbi:MAG TPA: serine/threonine protein kinase [Leptolyngbyaceae cyanobacterium M65_K2018_010]|nr:serine/threonine protein kinase [Leptolyngbyaceae cyanobacterium M65_K2018_010]